MVVVEVCLDNVDRVKIVVTAKLTEHNSPDLVVIDKVKGTEVMVF